MSPYIRWIFSLVIQVVNRLIFYILIQLVKLSVLVQIWARTFFTRIFFTIGNFHLLHCLFSPSIKHIWDMMRMGHDGDCNYSRIISRSLLMLLLCWNRGYFYWETGFVITWGILRTMHKVGKYCIIKNAVAFSFFNSFSGMIFLFIYFLFISKEACVFCLFVCLSFLEFWKINLWHSSNNGVKISGISSNFQKQIVFEFVK